jgi:pimeloyl-ACP methyl ester carboxylesterase
VLVDQRALVRRIWVPYRAWDREERVALLVLPAWYGPHLDPPIPLVISPHGRGGSATGNASYWGSLPAFGPFALVNPQGQGRRLTAYSWGWHGQIDDLSRMPAILMSALPWLHVQRSRIYAVGSSMGGQETLLLDALHPRLLAGAVALDSATNLAARYQAFAALPNGATLQALARLEIGGAPSSAPGAYALRSPITYADRLAHNRAPLYIWWSTADRVVTDQWAESGRLYRTIKRINPRSPVVEYVGSWAHSAEMYPLAQLPLALVELGVIKLQGPASEQVPLGSSSIPPRELDSVLIPVQIPTQVIPPSPQGQTVVVSLRASIAFAQTLTARTLKQAVRTRP